MKHLKKSLIPILKLFQKKKKIQEKGKFLNSFHETSITLTAKPDNDTIKELQANISEELIYGYLKSSRK